MLVYFLNSPLTLPFQFSFILAFKILVLEIANLSSAGIFFWNHTLFYCYIFLYARQLKTNNIHVFPHSEGRRHDAGMLRMSGLLTEVNSHAYSPTAHPLCIYGDPAYPLRIHLQAPYRNAQLTAEEQIFNPSMSTVRTAVEWVFGDISTYFALLDFKRNLKIGLSPVGKLYSISALLRNALTCLYGNTTSTFFNLDPPTIEEYFQY